MIGTLAAIACGGAVGALMRHGVNILAMSYFGAGFPYGTMIVNILGSFLMGLMITCCALFWQVSPELRVFIVTGFLGAFTTFSTFSLDFATLFERGDIMQAFLYAALSVVLSIAALFAGMFLVRGLAA